MTLAEHYGIPADAAVHDEEWLTLAGQRGWAVIMKDERIRYRRDKVATGYAERLDASAHERVSL